MKTTRKIWFLLLWFLTMLSISGCQKESIEEIAPQTQTQRIKSFDLFYPSWDRCMYVDQTDTMYTSTSGKNTLSSYLKRYGFNGVYFYSTSSILSSSSNFTRFSQFLKQLNDSGVVIKGVSSGSASTFLSGGSVSRYNASQTDRACLINRANLELEWWNGVTTWNNWNLINQSISTNGTIADNDFYEGWYKNLGSTIDTIAARDQVRFSNRILLHVYQNGIPTYSYANGQSSGTTGGRLDIIAKGARQANKRIDLYFIISSEKISFGAKNDFSGGILQANNSKPNPFAYIENEAYKNIVVNMTPFQKQWINFKGFIWFTKRYCYAAVPPR